MNIVDNYNRLRSSIPKYVKIVVAAKTRTIDEIREVIFAGASIIGENYVQEARKVQQELGNGTWHLIGHLQRNKVKDAVKIFDMIGTVDSIALVKEIDTRCASIGKIMPVLIEINSGSEPQKSGVLPENTLPLIRETALLQNIKIMGLMTMGPLSGNPESARPYFIETRKIFNEIKALNIPNVELQYLSMGMTNSYKVAIEEGSNMIRLGTAIFGERKS
ncbi:MAG: YggS family pyridoxal phosphate-dependent enzyme [Candidatus Stahlbacteria bacterium]|nr:YggS family pyridoxal phosphate-dependent enzyme [Candidatus Stahlbacteria bacterium]